ncbi:origin recognition complex subunit 1 (ORC1) [Vairimorpha necatrix]|uniref:Origin recognition complex subunit 1 n=1 Tax=Vairimorpha necatrix TaxID=6039 RepID=A0AAX4JFU5_9MICR
MTVIGREQEFKTLQLKIRKFLTDESNSNIFISGVPGSGKTHTIKQVLKDLNQDYIYLNAGHLKLKSLIYKEIFNKLKCQKSKKTDNLFSLRNHFMTCKTQHILIIDEIDLLTNKSQSFLYNLTDFAYLENTKILLICISNTMNLPEKFLESKVCSRFGKNRVDFKPYTHVKLKKILSSNYKDVNIYDVELISRRVASIFGDVRKAFSLVENIKESKEMTKLINKSFLPVGYMILPNLSKYQKILLNIVLHSEDFSISTIFKNFEFTCKSNNLSVLDFYDFFNFLKKFSTLGIIKFKDYSEKIIILEDVEEIDKIFQDDEDYNILKQRKFK